MVFASLTLPFCLQDKQKGKKNEKKKNRLVKILIKVISQQLLLDDILRKQDAEILF